VIGVVHAADEAAADIAEKSLRAAYTLSQTAPVVPSLIHERIS
jgi:thymidine phosphorylase